MLELSRRDSKPAFGKNKSILESPTTKEASTAMSPWHPTNQRCWFHASHESANSAGISRLSPYEALYSHRMQNGPRPPQLFFREPSARHGNRVGDLRESQTLSHSSPRRRDIGLLHVTSFILGSSETTWPTHLVLAVVWDKIKGGSTNKEHCSLKKPNNAQGSGAIPGVCIFRRSRLSGEFLRLSGDSGKRSCLFD